MIFILLLLSIFLAALPMFLYLGIIWWLDRYEREPLWLVALVFGWGAFGGILLGAVISLIFTVPIGIALGGHVAEVAGAVFVAPLVEEPAKGLILLLLVWNRNFDNATDGFVYGSAAGLGFGMVENFLYFATAAASGNAGMWFGMVFLRTLFTAPMHALACSCFGAALGYAKFQRSPAAWILLPVLGLGSAMTIHFLWNLLAVFSEQMSSAFPLLFSILVLGGEFVLLTVVFQLSLVGESRLIRWELAGEAAEGLIPPHHLDFIPYYFKRFGSGWLAPGISKRGYIAKATLLAFRRAELDRCGPGRRRFYETEVNRLRSELAAMLAAGQR